jgi:putative tryptophan/tyrosine transport system substrate-binding protein
MKLFSRKRVSESCSDNRKSKIQNLKWGGIVALVVTLAMCGAVVEAQQAKKVPRIGYLSSDSPSTTAHLIKAFRGGLGQLGYVEGQNITIEYRYAEGKIDRLPDLAAELVRLKVDIILASGGSTLVLAAKKASETIPMVMTNSADPVGSGVVASLAQPGGNVTGLSTLALELGGKRLELLKETVPKLSRVAVLGSRDTPNYGRQMKEIEVAAQVLGVQLLPVEMREPSDLENAFAAITKGRAGRLWD